MGSRVFGMAAQTRRGLFIGTLMGGVSMAALCALPAIAQEEAAQEEAAQAAAEEEAVELAPVFVTASPLATPLDELATPVTVVSRDEVLSSPAATIGALLKDKPGITESSFAAGASRPIIRGLDNTRVRVQENGLGAGDVSAVSEDHGVPIDPLSAERVEVVRGPATLRYGSEAIGGVVNIINNRIPTELPKDGFEGEASVSYDTVNDGRRIYGEMNAGEGNVVFHLDSFARKTDDYRIPGAFDRQTNTWTETSGIAGGASVLLDADAFSGYAGAAVSYYDSNYGIPAGDPLDPIHIDMWQAKLQVASELDFNGGPFSKLALTGGYSDYTHGEIDSAGATGSRFDNEEWEARGELSHRAVGPFTGAIGIHARGRQLEAAGEGGELIAPSDTDAIAGFIFEEMPLAGEWFKLQASGRAEHVNVTGTALDTVTALEFDSERSFTPLSFAAGLVANAGNGWVFGLNAQRVERAPDALELYSKGPHEATETFEIGDPTLDKETAQTFELTAKRVGDDYSFEAAVFHTKFSDFIYKRLTGITCDDDFASCGVGTELDQVLFTQEDATFRGLEAAGRVTLARWGTARAGLSGQFDMVRAELDAGGDVPRIPPMRAGAGVFYADETVAGEFGFLHAFEQDRISANETETGSYTNLKGEIRYLVPSVMGGNAALEFALVGENLLDEDIRNHVSFKKNDVLQPGRNVRLVVTARF
ncbi:TonB-dependent receptor [Parvibaculum lavamentivorans DS-1]|uniref:TonB-dependent receptor n=1 Tax=Parvibaculum lavamentivorans (strain DS-1 / DSM 13023 / NCIMB 13966) TaxID=402881 RepID=A7HU99_PARL1|nr:TonB-dependent receptor [Parvibaculum lavamentivorans]ABS63482.1 TonB-dependent receptor [Parvibaculum lavamentivorans DS-1]